jgi:3-phosphoshikimate 1-carboxyvinyltransferase
VDVLNLGPLAPLRGEIRLPGSKSLSNRYLLLSALAEGTTRLSGLLESEDTEAMLGALAATGVAVAREGEDFVVVGMGGANFRPASQALDLGNAGTAMRPLCAALCAARGEWVLDGVERMRERPIGDLVDGLVPLLAGSGRIESLGKPGFPPLRIVSEGLSGGRTEIAGNTSSQFLSALLMAAPLAQAPLEIVVKGDLISKPYVDITLALMARFGVEVERDGYAAFRIAPRRYVSPGPVAVEGDASSASYFLAFGAMGGPVKVRGCGTESIQGDARFASVLERMGAGITWGPDWIEARSPAGGARLEALDIDMNDMPDAAMTLATLGLFARGKTVIRNIGSWRVKETERVVAVRTELEKLGAEVEEGPDWIAVTPPETLRHARIATYRDHRMAMAFSLAALGTSLEIEDPACTAKTFPDYFEALSRLAAR